MRTIFILAAARLLLHTLTNGQYGFHRDELATIDDGRHLAWGYVAYPPFTPFAARAAMALFGTAPTAVRFFAGFAQSIVMVLAGLMARELGGSRKSQILAALAVAASPVSLSAGHLLQYVSFDLLWSVAAIYFLMRLLRSGDLRWWIAVGAAIGLGVLTKYTIGVLVAALFLGFLLTPARRFLASRWFVVGIVVCIAIALPNLVWQWQHDFISLDFLRAIHARDVAEGRADGFWWKQLLIPANLFSAPLWIAGLWFFFRRTDAARFRPLGWAFAFTIFLYAVLRAREYYTAPVYPMLFAAGAIVWDGWSAWARRLTWAGLAVGTVAALAFILPIAPVNSRWFQAAMRANYDLREEIGWTELVDSVSNIYAGLPESERGRAGILTGNYGEAGAINLYGPARHLPPALSRVNSFWLRGYGNHPPDTLIVVGIREATLRRYFSDCQERGQVSNSFGIENEEFHNPIWVCSGLREPWPEFWRRIRAWA